MFWIKIWLTKKLIIFFPTFFFVIHRVSYVGILQTDISFRSIMVAQDAADGTYLLVVRREYGRQVIIVLCQVFVVISSEFWKLILCSFNLAWPPYQMFFLVLGDTLGELFTSLKGVVAEQSSVFASENLYCNISNLWRTPWSNSHRRNACNALKRVCYIAVSYTHLTLPTILLV